MKGQWAQRAQAILGQSDWGLSTERVDDGALRIVQLGKRGLPEVLDRHSPRHGTPRGLSWGWTAVIGLASSVTAGDHRTVSGATSLQGLPPTLSARTAQGIAPLAVSADRLSHRRQPWSQPTYGHQSARALQARSLEGHAWPQDVIRGDATPVSGEPAVPEGGLGPFGPRQAAPTRPPSTVRLGALAPLGRPLSTAVWAGARADDGLSLPRIERMRSGWNHTGLLVVGAGQMRA
jgi:hypothetical protein